MSLVKTISNHIPDSHSVGVLRNHLIIWDKTEIYPDILHEKLEDVGWDAAQR